MKVWTVTAIYLIDGAIDDVSPFVHSFRTKEAAVQAVEEAAVEEFEYMVDPNDGDVHKFPGCNWNDNMTSVEGLVDTDERDDFTRYTITETEVEG